MCRVHVRRWAIRAACSVRSNNSAYLDWSPLDGWSLRIFVFPVKWTARFWAAKIGAICARGFPPCRSGHLGSEQFFSSAERGHALQYLPKKELTNWNTCMFEDRNCYYTHSGTKFSKKSFWLCFKILLFLEGMSRYGHRSSEWDTLQCKIKNLHRSVTRASKNLTDRYDVWRRASAAGKNWVELKGF